MGIREDLLALADELDGVSIKDDCESCLASGTGLCRGDLECAESAHKACAKRLREIVERDECEATTVNAYDLLSDDDREALAWVREMGGIERCEAFVHQGAMEHGYLLKIAHALGTSIYDGTDNADALLDKLEKRLMPDGMEWLLDVWPKWDNGEYCRFGDWWTAENYGEGRPRQLSKLSIYTPEYLAGLGRGNGESYGYAWDFFRSRDVEYHPVKVEPPAPKVLDADGVEISVGDTVYLLPGDWCGKFPCLGYHGGEELEVFSLHANHVEGGIGCRNTRRPKGTCYPQPSQLTHRAPVLAADGEPLEVGDHVWWTWGGQEYVVEQVRSSEEVYVTLANGEFSGQSANPRDLTHQRPVLDADGVEVHKGDEVWSTTGEFDGKRTVSSVHIDPDEPPYATFEERQKPYSCLCCYLIHRAPVIAADGKPLRVGETVYKVGGDGTAYVFDGMSDNVDGLAMLHHDGKPYIGTGLRVGQLTHEQPDDWSLWREDLELSPVEYTDRYRVGRFGHEELDTYRDLVRRARKLAEKESR